jgi:hypothetical protein
MHTSMFTLAIGLLMIANTLAASGAIFAARQISFLEPAGSDQAKRSDDAAREASRVEDRALAKAA